MPCSHLPAILLTWRKRPSLRQRRGIGNTPHLVGQPGGQSIHSPCSKEAYRVYYAAMIIIGIDPGVTGAMSRFDDAGRLTDIADIPADTRTKARSGAELRDLIGGGKTTTRHVVNPAAVADILRGWVEMQPARIVREKVGSRPSQGIVSTGRLLEVVGMLDGIAAALAIPVETVEPETWKRATGTPTLKKDACIYAAKVFPEWAEKFKRTSIDHNRAESALIGWYGVRFLTTPL